MAKKKAARSASNPAVDKKIVDDLWLKIPQQEWVDALHRHTPSARVDATGTSIKSTCCFHPGDASPSLFINFEKKLAKCFSSNCGQYEKDPIKLWGHLNRMPMDKAIKDIKQRFGITLLSAEKMDELVRTEAAFDMHEMFLKVCHRALEISMNDPNTTLLEDTGTAVDYITRVRKAPHVPHGIPMGVIVSQSNIEYILRDLEIDMSHDAKRDFIEFLAPIRDMSYVGQLIFAYRMDGDRIRNFKIRKVRNLDGSLMEDTKQFITFHHAYVKEFQQYPAFYGVDYYKRHVASDPSLYLVEGEFDYLTIVNTQMNVDNVNHIFLAIGGSATRDIDCLRSMYDVSRVYLLFDAPSARGDELAATIINGTDGHVTPYVYKWENAFYGKDPDEVLINSEFPKSTYAELVNHENYHSAEEFCIKKIRDELGTKPLSSLEKNRIVKDHCVRIADPLLSRIVLKMGQEQFGVIAEEILRSMVSHSDDESLFLHRIKDIIRSKFKILGHGQGDDADGHLILWSYAREEIFFIDVTSIKDITNVLAPEFGAFSETFQNSIGIPICYRHKSGAIDSAEKTRLEVEADVRRAVSMSLQSLLEDIPRIGMDEMLNGGVFYLEDKKGPASDWDESEEEKTFRWYINNDRHLFIGTPNSAGKIEFKRHREPLINGHLFNLSAERHQAMRMKWSDFLTTEKHVVPPTLSLRETLEKTRHIINACFVFTGNVDHKIISLMCLYSSIHAIFPRKIFLALCGETSSGKSRIGEGIFGGKVSRWLHLVDAVLNLSHYTEAGMRQIINGRSLMVTLDEFEDTGRAHDEKSNVVRRILETIRTAETNTSVVKGTPTGEAKVFSIQAPIITMAIRTSLAPADYNRFIHVTTRKVQGHRDAEDIVKDLYSLSEIDEIRHSNLLAPIFESHQIMKYYNRYREETSRKDHPLRSIPFRTLGQIIILASIEAAAFDDINAGYDLIKLYHKEHAEQIKEVAAVGLTKDIWDEVFSSANIKISSVKATTDSIVTDKTLEYVLNNSALRDQLIEGNVSGMRLFVTDSTDISIRRYFLIIAWPAARRTLFSRGSEFLIKTPNALKELAERDSSVLPRDQWTMMGIPEDHIRSVSTSYNQVTIYECTRRVYNGE